MAMKGKLTPTRGKRFRVALVAQPKDVVPPPKGSSISIHIYETARRLAAEFDVTVYSARHPLLPDIEERDGVKYVRFAINRDRQAEYYLKRVSDKFEAAFGRPIGRFSTHFSFQPYYYLFYALQVGSALRRWKPDIVQVQNYYKMLPILRKFHRTARIVFGVQCEWLSQVWPREARRRLKEIDAVFGCSNYIIQKIRDAYPDHENKFVTIYNGVNIEAFTPRGGEAEQTLRSRHDLKDKKVILYVGRIAPEKGVHVLLDAVKRLAGTMPNLRLLLVGSYGQNPPVPPGPFEKADAPFANMRRDYGELIKKKIDELGGRVLFVGHLSQDELPSFYRIADVFVHHALWDEPFGMTIAEAMACGTPVIATPTGGIPEFVVDGVGGRLVPPGNAETLANALRRILNFSEERGQMERTARQVVEQSYTWDRVSTQLSTLYKKICEN